MNARRPAWNTACVTLLRVSDPDHFALRNAVRAAVVVPGAFAIGQLGFDNPNTGLFAGFGALGILLFADFSGPRLGRLAAYVVLFLTGAVLITIGTLCSHSPLLAAVVMAVVGFVVLFSGIINAYIAAGTNAALLTFILAVMVPASALDIPSRLTGWAIGGVLAITATMVLLPARPRDKLRAAAAEACRALADLVAEPSEPGREKAARAAINALRERFVATPFRPTGSTGPGAALASIVDELGWLFGLATSAELDVVEAEGACAANVAVLRESAERLSGDRVTIELDRVVEVREDLLDGLVRRLGDAAVRNDDNAIRDALHSTWQLRVISYATLQIGELAQTATGSMPPLAAQRSLAAVRQLLADHANLRSVWMRNTLRATAGLSLAVLVGQLASVQNAFWIVLGTLTVLRSNALGTGASVLRALLGTTIGIVIGGALVVVIGTNEVPLWIALPPAIFFAAYAPRAISFAAGQAGFTVAVLVFFNLIAPSGWEVGLVRVQDVAIGFAISVVVGLLFWPRGAAAILRRSLDEAYEACAACLAMCVGWLLDGGPSDQLTRPRRQAVARERLLDTAVRQFLSERAPPAARIDDVAMLVAGAVRLRVTGDALVSMGEHVGSVERHDAEGSVHGDSESVRAWYSALGVALAARSTPPAPAIAERELPPEVLEGVRTAATTGDRAHTLAAVVVSWASEHLDLLRRQEDRITQAAARIAQDRPA
jgi:uncharacterized membrane protein YccC